MAIDASNSFALLFFWHPQDPFIYLSLYCTAFGPDEMTLGLIQYLT